MTAPPTAATLAPVPPMGWNSWDCFGTTVTEDEVLANAEVMRTRLLPAGWDHVVVDIDWYDPTARAHGYNDDAPVVLDDYGRQLPAADRFPSSRDGSGFANLARAVHEKGLKFGIHIVRGIPRRAVDLDLPILGTEWTAAEVADRSNVCTWHPHNLGLNHDHPGAQAYYDAQVAQFAEWGVDFIKADDMQAPYYHREIEAYALAIARSGRPMTLSLSPGTHLSTLHIDHLRRHAQMWRISDDLWDRWEDVHAQFARLARWAPLQGSGGWADADMLPLGRIGLRAERGEPRNSRLSGDEQRSLLTLWAMGRSPLMVGADLPSTEESTLGMLANPALREVTASTTGNAEVIREPHGDGEIIVWSARSSRQDRWYLAAFWTGESELTTPIALASVTGLPAMTHQQWNVSDLWEDGGEMTPLDLDRGHVSVRVPSHGVRWLALEPRG